MRDTFLHEIEIALELRLHDACRVARVDDLDARDNLEEFARWQIEALMDAADVAEPRQMLEQACLRERHKHTVVLVHVDIDHAAGDADDAIVIFEADGDGTQVRERFLRKVFIGIEEQDPMPVRLVECEILCGGEVVLPRKRIDLGAAFFRELHGVVRAARIDDDDLVGDGPHGGEPFFDVLRLVLHDGARRDLERLQRQFVMRLRRARHGLPRLRVLVLAFFLLHACAPSSSCAAFSCQRSDQAR